MTLADDSGLSLATNLPGAGSAVAQDSGGDVWEGIIPTRTEVAASSAADGSPVQLQQELQLRAQYWENRGREDLADKVRSQLQQMAAEKAAAETAPAKLSIAEKAPSPNARAPGVAGAPERAVAAQMPAADGLPSRLQRRAQYWENRGREDLADKARSQLQQITPKKAVAEIAPARLPVAEKSPPFAAGTPAVAGALAAPTLDSQVRYWESHGREDLANQIRQKLQAMEPSRAVSPPVLNAPETAQRQSERLASAADSQPGRSALEESLLKAPNGLEARLDLVQIYRNAGELAKARAQIESILATRPDLPVALYASARLYADQRLWRETLDTLERVSPASRTQEMANLQKMAWAHVQLDRADALARQGRNAEAQVLLRRVALELAIESDQVVQPEPPPLWKPAPVPTARKKR